MPVFPVARMPFRNLALNEFLSNVRENVHGNWGRQAFEDNNSYYLLSTLFCGRFFNMLMYLNLNNCFEQWA